MKGKPRLANTTKTGAVTVKEMTTLVESLLINANDAGLGPFTGTHILRQSMGTFTRKETGLDTAQAMLSLSKN
jgi:hypothetical protein